MNVETKIKEAKKIFKKGTRFVSFDYPNWGTLNEQIDNEIVFKKYQPNFLWVRAKASFGEIMWMIIYDFSKNQWVLTESDIINKKAKQK